MMKVAPRKPAPVPAPVREQGPLSAPEQVVDGRFGKVLADFGIGALFWMVAHVPAVPKLLRGTFLNIAWVFSSHVRAVTLCNLKRILPESTAQKDRRRLGKEILGSFYDFVCDVERTARLPREKWDGQIAEIVGQENWQRARELRRGAVIATAHMGSFEAGLCAMLQVEKHIHVVYKRDASSRFERLRAELRRNLGVIEAAVDDGLANWIRLRDALLADEVVAIQADRVVPGQKGVKVKFLGGHVLLPDGPVKLAAITGSPILPVFTVRQSDGRVKVIIEPAVQVRSADAGAIEEAMRQLAGVIARQVQRYPEQWLVLQRAWLEDQPGKQAEGEKR